MTNPLDRCLLGALAGAAATVPMTAAMAALFPALPREEQGPLPPRRITRRLVAKAGWGESLPEPAETTLTALGHFGYGAAAGAAFALLAPRLPLPEVVSGVGMGLAVWAASYLGWLPAAGLHPPATREPAGRNALMLAAHVIYGGALGAITELLLDRSGRAADNGRDVAP